MEKDNITEENKHMETNFVKSFVEEIDGLNIEERESIEKEKILITQRRVQKKKLKKRKYQMKMRI